jgi:hypothetical protein
MRRRFIGLWHHGTTGVGGAQAALTVSRFSLTVGQLPSTAEGLMSALTVDYIQNDTQNNRILWGLYILRNGVTAPADPTTSDVLTQDYWCYGAEKLTSSYGLCVHVNPRTRRRFNANDQLIFYYKNLDALSANALNQIRYDYHFKVM